MCGILGYVGLNTSKQLPLPLLHDALDTLQHRGPDGEGEWHNDQVYLGHRRLSIIDLTSAGNQPFISNSGLSLLTYNGEVYNYKSLSTELTLRSRSDTEVIIEGYEKFGAGYFLRLKGIYAFGLVDLLRSKLLLYRDAAGVKPLYYARHGDEFAFASEIKSLVKIFGPKLTINLKVIEQFLQLGFIPEPATVYNEIEALPPGHLLELDLKTSKTLIRTLFKYAFQFENSFSFEENSEQTDSLLKQAAARNQTADVKVNLALSGGIDSSLISSYSKDFGVDKAITIKLGEASYNEVPAASAFANHLGLNHFVSEVNTSNHLELLNRLLKHFDQPYADSSLVPFYFLCNESAKYSKVLIGGDGGDEIHNGYLTHRVFPLLSALQRSGFVRSTSGAAALSRYLLPTNLSRFILKYNSLVKTHDRGELLYQMLSWFPATPRQYPINPFISDYEQAISLNKLQATEIKDSSFVQRYLFEQRMISDFLRKADMMSMINGLEYRVPMLDEDLVSFSLTIPSNQKSTLCHSKIMLRAIHAKYFPPTLSKLKKKGFSLPLDTWLGGNLLKEIKSNLNDSNSIVRNYITPQYIDLLFRTLTNTRLQRYTSRESTYQRILILYSLDLWNRNRQVA
jgi:asparagine synthase (glutamine-hydrolysing)